MTGLSDKAQAYLALADRTAIAVGTFWTSLEFLKGEPLYGIVVAGIGVAIAVIKEAEGVLGGTPVDINKFIADITARIQAIQDYLKPAAPATTTTTTTGAPPK